MCGGGGGQWEGDLTAKCTICVCVGVGGEVSGGEGGLSGKDHLTWDQEVQV